MMCSYLSDDGWIDDDACDDGGSEEKSKSANLAFMFASNVE